MDQMSFELNEIELRSKMEEEFMERTKAKKLGQGYTTISFDDLDSSEYDDNLSNIVI